MTVLETCLVKIHYWVAIELSVVRKKFHLFNKRKNFISFPNCGLIDAIYSVSIAVVVFLSVPVEIVENPTNVTHFAGGAISINCSASGIPSPVLVWYKNGQQVFEDENIEISNTTLVKTPNEIVIQSTLHLINLDQSDDADYSCEASNLGVNDSVFVATTGLAHLSVQCEL